MILNSKLREYINNVDPDSCGWDTYYGLEELVSKLLEQGKPVMKDCPATLLLDVYKGGHPLLYNPDITHMFINYTSRFGHYCNVKDNEEVMNLGMQYFCIEFLIDRWNTTFFQRDKAEAVGEFCEVMSSVLGFPVEAPHLEALHDLQYLPLEIRSLPEGVMVPYGVPAWTAKNTVAGFGWVAEMIETLASSETWGMSTSGTTAFAYRKRFERTQLDKAFIKFMGHDFSYRGMFGTQAASTSGFGHLTCLVGSDTVPAGIFARDYYGADFKNQLVMASVIATEHSVATSYLIPIMKAFEDTGKYKGKTPEEHWGCEIPEAVGIHLVAEFIYLKFLMTEKVPTGILSCVIDSIDFWGVIKYVLPQLKDIIMARDGKFVCRPDSGDPVKVVTGYNLMTGVDHMSSSVFLNSADAFAKGLTEAISLAEFHGYEGVTFHGINYALNGDIIEREEAIGMIQCLWETFGGDESNGLKVLDEHIGAIYGDSITLERQDQIIDRLEQDLFLPSVVLGIGSYSYQYVTRDTNGSAIKATDVQFGEGNHVAIYKDPKTDSKKKSAKGLLLVDKDPETGKYRLVDDVTEEEECSDRNLLTPLYRNGVLLRATTLEEIRGIVDAQFE